MWGKHCKDEGCRGLKELGWKLRAAFTEAGASTSLVALAMAAAAGREDGQAGSEKPCARAAASLLSFSGKLLRWTQQCQNMATSSDPLPA